MHRDHDIFVQAIKEKIKIRLIYYDGPLCQGFQAKSVVPVDYNPGHRITDKSDSYQFWDFEEGTKGSHLVLKPGQIESMKLDKKTFEPSEFMRRNRKKWRRWFVERDWGQKFS